MMIEDEELRTLYQISSEERLQNLEAGLVQLEQCSSDEAILKEMRREIHTLKGDSRSVGIESIANLSQRVEEILKRLQNQALLMTPDVSNALFLSIHALQALVYEAVTDQPSGIDIEELCTVLAEALSSPASQSVPSLPDVVQVELDIVPSSIEARPLIDDPELRKIYQTTSFDRVQKLEVALVQLEQQSDNETLLAIMLRQIHSLKGDSRSLGLDAIEELSRQIEEIFKRIQSRELQLSIALSNEIYIGLRAIKRLVHEAVSGEPSAVEMSEVLTSITEALSLQPAPQAERLPILRSSSLDLPASTTIVAPEPEEPELLEIYQTTSLDRLQKLESGLVQLEHRPQDAEILAELLREAHSLKGDSRSVGIETVEALTHQFEGVLGCLQRQDLILTPDISDRLYVSLDVIKRSVQEAGSSTVETTDVLSELLDAVQVSELSAEQQQPFEQFTVLSDYAVAALEEIDRRDSIRVPTQDLNELMTEAETLAITRIQISQTTTQVEQLFRFWQDWKTSRSQEISASERRNLQPDEARLEHLINTLQLTIGENQTKLDRVTESLSKKIQALRLLPLSMMLQKFPRMVRDLAKQQSKVVELIIEGGETTADKQILDGVQDALTHLLRNAIDHGVESPEERAQLGKPSTALIRVRSYKTSNQIIIEVSDDGRGLDLEQIKQTAIRRRLYSSEELENMPLNQLQMLILAPGFSTRTLITEISGRGVGLDVVRTTIERMKGRILIESAPGQGCTFRLQISTALATLTVVLVEVQGILYALPFDALQTARLVALDEIVSFDDRDAILLEEQPVLVTPLVDILELSNSPIFEALSTLETASIAQPNLYQSDSAGNSPRDRRSCVLLKVGDAQAGFFVDRLLNTQEVVLKPQSQLLKRVRNVLGATTLATGEVCMVLNPAELIQSVQQPKRSIVSLRAKAPRPHKPVILLVEDSPPVRVQEKRLFEKAGYEVVVAIDGLDGYTKLREQRFDAVVSDIEMPNLDGLSLTARIRQHTEYSQLPIVLVSTLSSEDDQRRGAEAGANAYITKGKFNQNILLETLARLI